MPITRLKSAFAWSRGFGSRRLSLAMLGFGAAAVHCRTEWFGVAGSMCSTSDDATSMSRNWKSIRVLRRRMVGLVSFLAASSVRQIKGGRRSKRVASCVASALSFKPREFGFTNG